MNIRPATIRTLGHQYEHQEQQQQTINNSIFVIQSGLAIFVFVRPDIIEIGNTNCSERYQSICYLHRLNRAHCMGDNGNNVQKTLASWSLINQQLRLQGRLPITQWTVPKLTYRQPAKNDVLTDQLCQLYSLVNHAYANRYHHHLIR